ncbi:DUF4270 family protein [Panacibacter sp. DH6]|uniref:DUF4270 family protein n=1 Tax=Panacibacter microcysteis TaxID=2793269 RepID=A0A931E754_9BACT|nr:DUF4270 family protein [Panacibacter microcysteis]
MKKLLPLFAILACAIVTIFSCTKIVNTEIGGDLLPPIDGVNTKEMFLTISTKNIKDTITKVGYGIPNALGYVNDGIFGKTTASINLELKPASYPVVFPVSKDSLFIDSVVLVLSYSGVWGDTTQQLGMRVYKIKNNDPSVDVLRADTTYDTNYETPRGDELTENFAEASVDIRKLNDSIYPRNEAAINQLRIRLDKSYGLELLKNYDTTSTGAYHNDSLFERTFKGYQIVPSQKGNALVRINILDTNTKLAIYYNYLKRDTAGGVRDTVVKYFNTNQYSNRTGSSNNIKHDRNGTDIPKFLPANNDKSDSLLFVDANPGIYTRLLMDSLSGLSNRIIHRAEIIMEQVPGNPVEDGWLTPPALFLTPISYGGDSTPRFALPYDVTISNGVIVNQATFGCYPLKKTDPVTQQSIYYYSFDVSRYVQNVISRGDSTFPLILYAPSNDFVYLTESSIYTAYTGTSSGPLNTPAIGRVRLGGGNHSAHRMRLHIVYSDIQ